MRTQVGVRPVVDGRDDSEKQDDETTPKDDCLTDPRTDRTPRLLDRSDMTAQPPRMHASNDRDHDDERVEGPVLKYRYRATPLSMLTPQLVVVFLR